MRAVWVDLEADTRPLAAADLPALGEHPDDEHRESADLTTEDPGQHFGLAVVGALVDKDAGGSLGLARPQVALPSPDQDEARIVKTDVAVVALPDMPKQHRLADTVIRGLREGARACDGATAIVEPVSGDAPPWNLGHRKPPQLLVGLPPRQRRQNSRFLSGAQSGH